jgi:hypothetical protein
MQRSLIEGVVYDFSHFLSRVKTHDLSLMVGSSSGGHDTPFRRHCSWRTFLVVHVLLWLMARLLLIVDHLSWTSYLFSFTFSVFWLCVSLTFRLGLDIWHDAVAERLGILILIFFFFIQKNMTKTTDGTYPTYPSSLRGHITWYGHWLTWPCEVIETNQKPWAAI